MNWKGYIIIIAILSVFLEQCYHEPQVSITDMKFQAVKGFPSLNDTFDIGVKRVSEDEHNHWYIAYNKETDYPKLFMYHEEDPEEVTHVLDLSHKFRAAVKELFLEDVTHDGKYELVVELSYHYDFSYQAREILIYQNPFDTIHEIFDFRVEEMREQIDSFDEDYGMPIIEKEVETHATYQFFEGFILLKGTIFHHENHVLEYQWDKRLQEFKLIIDEDLHEAEDEEQGGFVHVVKGEKVLKPVASHERGCKSYLLEDIKGHVIAVDEMIHDALLCSNVTSLSKGGRYLIYTNQHKSALELYDFKNDTTVTLLDHIHVYEGISDIVWSHEKYPSLAFVALNPEEFAENTSVFVYHIQGNDDFTKEIYPVKVVYECLDEANCIPQKDYDFGFNRNKKVYYRIAQTGRRSDDFALVN